VDAERGYLDEVMRRLHDVLGENLIGVYAGGSYALGGYERGRSDLDVAAVVRHALAEGVVAQIVAAVRHEALPVPARKLELVAYRLADARATGVEPRFELNLNTGPEEFRADPRPQPGEGHWFAIDRSVLAQSGIALFGPPAAEVFASPSRTDLRPVLADVLRWYLAKEPESVAAALNAGRALRYAREGIWVGKPAVREWAEAQPGSGREILGRAIAELERAPEGQVRT
jgi:predicted nucleotidyltransferase